MSSAKAFPTVRAFAIVTGGLLGLLLSTSIALADGFPGSVPKAHCGPGDHTESGLQGQTTVRERFSGDSERAYNCNLQLVGQHTGQGAYSQDGPAYAGNCAYYGTDNDTSLQKHHGVTVVNASNPAHPRVTAYLNNTSSALTPHETVQTDRKSTRL